MADTRKKSGGKSGKRASGARSSKRAAPKRGAPKRGAPKRAASKRAAPKRGGSRRKAAGGSRGSRRRAPKKPSLLLRLRRFVVRVTAATALGGVLGGGLVVGGLYREATVTVDERLAGALWDTSGQVLSGPVDLWTGLALTPTALGTDLERSGYVRSSRPERPGDYSVSGDAVLIRTREASGEGWRTRDQEVLITFADGAISSISPGGRVTLPPSRLAAIRGPDNEARTPRDLDHFPKALQDAVLAMEDDRFWDHPGVSPWGIARALVVNAVEGERVQGGSTLTQQLAKNLFLTPERSYARKAREALLAFALEQRLSKEEILALYLNEIYWGQAGGAAICGADEAAKAYFGKPADRLTLGEAATLGGVISAPNGYSPLRHLEAAQKRRDLALERMVEVGWLDAADAEAASARDLTVRPSPSGRVAPYAVDTAMEKVDALMGEGSVLREGLTVRTTIHPPLQRLAERSLAEGLAAVEAAKPEAKGVQAALVAVRVSDGAVLAMVGGRDYGASQFNRSTLARRQIGSTVKPLTLLAALEADEGLSPATMMEDKPITRTISGKSWSPGNYDGRYVEALPLREAITRSRNIPAVLLAEEVGMAKLMGFNKKLGLTGATAHLSAALGSFEASPLELAGAYTAFPGKGWRSEPVLLKAIRDSEGDVIERRDKQRTRVASDRAAYMATDVLLSVIAEGTGSGARKHGLERGVGGKTGTTDSYRDAWFAGFTHDVVVVVWVGFDRVGPTGLTGASGALPIWARFVAGSGLAGEGFERPDSVVLADACVGGFEKGKCQECDEELFTRGEAPKRGCSRRLLARGGRGDDAPDDDDEGRDVWDAIEDAVKGDDKRRPFWKRDR